ncbi:MAG: sigma-70 family RNA polymerase sigma factor [Phycisphaerales bacterium]|jgi:RNA polymerase primary sigma factor
MEFNQTDRLSQWRAARLLKMQLPNSRVESVGDRASRLADYLRMVGEIDQLSAQQERELGWKAINEDCPHSRERMYEANLPLVVTIAGKFTGRGMPLDGLIDEGNLGLLDAVAEFDPARGARFSTRASWWIKSAIRGALTYRSPLAAV